MRNDTRSHTVEEEREEMIDIKRKKDRKREREKEQGTYRERLNRARVPAELTATSARSWKNHGTTPSPWTGAHVTSTPRAS